MMGQTIEFAGRKPAWREAGIKSDQGRTPMESMDDAGLMGWNLRKVPLTHVDFVNGAVDVPGKYINLRDVLNGKPRALGIVGDRYHNLSNEVIGHFIEVLLSTAGDDSGIYVDAAGSVDGGSRAFITMGLADSTLNIGGFDSVAMYLTAIWTHDGSSPLVLVPMPTRLSCTNQLRGLTRGSRAAYRVKHLSGAGDLTGKVAEAQAALGLTQTYISDLVEEAEKKLAVSVTNAKFSEIIAASFPEIGKLNSGELTGRALTMAQTRHDELVSLWNGPTVQGAGIGGTAYGALQAIGEYIDWIGSVKGSGTLGTDAARARRGLVTLDTVESAKEKVAKVLDATV